MMWRRMGGLRELESGVESEEDDCDCVVEGWRRRRS